MAYPFLDTDIIIRFLTGDDPQKQAAAAALFQRIEQGSFTVAAPVTVIADAVFVLHSPRLYNKPRPEVQALLTPWFGSPTFGYNSDGRCCGRWSCMAAPPQALGMRCCLRLWSRPAPRRSIRMMRALIRWWV
jgi:hypothetical protein